MSIETATYVNHFQQLLLRLSTEFINLPWETYDDHIELALELIGSYVGVEHCYIVLFEADDTHIHIEHEWSAPGHSPLEGRYAETLSPWFEAKIKNQEVVPLTSIHDLPPEAETMRANLMASQVQSFLDVPLVMKDTVIGFIGFESVTHEHEWTEEMVNLLVIVGKIYVNAYERHQVELAQLYYNAFQQLILDLSTEFIDATGLQLVQIIEKSLENIGEFVRADRSFVGFVSDDQQMYLNIHEWCAEGIESSAKHRQQIPTKRYPWLLQQFKDAGVVHIPQLDDMPPEARRLRRILQAGDIQSLIAIPLVYQGQWLGYLGFDSVGKKRDWTPDVIALIKIVGQIVTNALARQKSEADSIEKERLQIALDKQKKLNEVFSTLSHDSRTPLSIISTAAEMVINYSHQLSDARQKHHLNVILSQVDQLDHLIGTLSVATKADGDYFSFHPEPLDVLSFTQQIVDKLQFTTQPDQTLLLKSPRSMPMFYMDSHLMEHVLINLISNAIKYSPEGGAIRVRILLTYTDLVFSVQDSGMGIAEDDLHQLFEPYFRASNVGNIRGTGLGLKIVKDCVELHGGRIDVESQLGKRTTFTVTFPREKVALPSDD